MSLTSKIGLHGRGLFCGLLATLLLSGCGAPDARFQGNWVYLRSQEKQAKTKLDAAQISNVHNILAGLFGTPDEPTLPALEEVTFTGFVDQDKLAMSAGPVGTDDNGRAKGLFRRHCAHCHGVTGDGLGPTAGFLNPYPRDYRLGIFKFKSTSKSTPPTHDDLMKTLYEGIPDTSMPSFKTLARDELEALAHYVKYLAIRGELERQLIFQVVNELEEHEQLVDMSKKNSADEADREAFKDGMDTVKELAKDIVQKWLAAPEAVTKVAPRPAAVGGAESAVDSLRSALAAQADGKTGQADIEAAKENVDQLLDALAARGGMADDALGKLREAADKAIAEKQDRGKFLATQTGTVGKKVATVAFVAAELADPASNLADALATMRPIHQEEHQMSVSKGRSLFFTKNAACSGCHGETALGNGESAQAKNFHDDWTKELEPTDPKAVREYMSLGALKPRKVRPRNLRMGSYRGGRRPIDVFWRIHNGIAGTPMPAASLKKTPDGPGLSTDDIWHITDYVLHMPYESISQPERFEPTNTDEVR